MKCSKFAKKKITEHFQLTHWYNFVNQISRLIETSQTPTIHSAKPGTSCCNKYGAKQ